MGVSLIYSYFRNNAFYTKKGAIPDPDQRLTTEVRRGRGGGGGGVTRADGAQWVQTRSRFHVLPCCEQIAELASSFSAIWGHAVTPAIDIMCGAGRNTASHTTAHGIPHGI